MNPNYEQPDLSLPPPRISEPLPVEQAPPLSSPEASPPPSQTPSVPVAGTMPMPPITAALPGTSLISGPTAHITTPVLADDTDLIEKEWVEKAKAIVAGTRDDPFIQSRDVSRFKADYIKKRYNKDIKLPET